MATTEAPTTPPAGTGDPPAAGQVPASTEDAGVAATSQGQSPNGEPSGTDAGEGATPEDPAELKKQIAAAEKAREKAVSDAATYRQKLREREQADREREREGQSDEERRQAEAQEREEFEQERTQFRLERAMARVGGELNLVDPDAALWLLDWNAIDFDDNGDPTNLKPLTEALIQEKSYLVKPTTTTPPATPVAPTIGASSGAAVAGPPPALTAEELAYCQATGMDPARYARLKNVKTLDDYKKATPATPPSAGAPA